LQQIGTSDFLIHAGTIPWCLVFAREMDVSWVMEFGPTLDFIDINE